MNVRVTISRVVRQYAELMIAGVESPEVALCQVKEDLMIPVRRARVLREVAWFGTDLLSDPEEVLEASPLS
jgi:hypothetical protein